MKQIGGKVARIGRWIKIYHSDITLLLGFLVCGAVIVALFWLLLAILTGLVVGS